MARPRNPKRDQAFEIWKKSGGKKKLKDIAAELNVSDSQIRKWKNQDDWETKLNGNVTNQSNGNVTKRGAPKGNKNAIGNKGGGAPRGNQNAKGNRGGAAPIGNKNAVTTGEYETIMWDYLDDDEKELYNSIETDPLYRIDATIRELSIRQRRMMKRIKKIESGLTEKQRRVLQEMKKVKDVVETYDEITGQSKKVPITQEKLMVTEIEETEFRVIDDILNIEEALTRVTDKLIKAIRQKHDMEKSIGVQGLNLEKLRVEIDKIKLEMAKAYGEDEEFEDDGFLDALNGTAEEVWDDET